MKFHILTLFPEMVMQGLNTSIIGRAAEKKLITLNAVNIREFTADRHGKVDDYPYGGGAGMLMQAQPIYDSYKSVAGGCNTGKQKVRTVYVTPQGIPFTQSLAADLAQEEELVFLCGHYEGIDERVLQEVVTDYVSIGDYILTGGELPAMVMIDAISRLVPGVLNNDSSAETESFHNDLLEYPQYSRPEVWRGREVPGILLSGDHKKIAKWRLERSKERTKLRRPDLYEKYIRKEQLIGQLSKHKRSNIHLMESLFRGNGEILYAQNGNLLLYDKSCKLCMVSAQSREEGDKLLALIPEETQMAVTSQAFLNETICDRFSFQIFHECFQACYPQKQTLPVKHKDIRLLLPEDLNYVTEHYRMGSEAYIQERIRAKVMYGAFIGEKPVGFVGMHDDGSMGMLFVEEAYRGQGIGASLEAYIINRILEKGWTPYAHVIVGNEGSLRLQKNLGLYISNDTIWWLGKKE